MGEIEKCIIGNVCGLNQSLLSPQPPKIHRHFTAYLESQGTNIFHNTWFPTQIYLSAFPYIELTSRQPWNLHQIEFPLKKYYVKEEIEARNVSSIGIKFRQSIEDDELQIADEEDIILNS